MNRLSRQTFDDFVVGDRNRSAYMAAIEVAKNPGIRYNPLFLYGGTGTGKSHLLSAIAREVAHNDPSMRIHYMSYQALSAKLHESLETGTRGQIHQILSKVDVFLLDDVRSDDSWLAVQQELIDWIDRFIQEERQIVFASDKSPLALDPYEEKFLSRIQRGLVVSLEQVDRAVKRKLIARWLEAEGIDFADETLDLLAELPVVDIRELAGIVNRLLVSLSANRATWTGEWVTTTLRQLIGTGEIRKFRVTPTVRPAEKTVREEWFKTAGPEEPELNEILSIAEMDVQLKKEPLEDEDSDTGVDRGVVSAQTIGEEEIEAKAGAKKDQKLLEIGEAEGFFMEWDREIDRLLDEL